MTGLEGRGACAEEPCYLSRLPNILNLPCTRVPCCAILLLCSTFRAFLHPQHCSSSSPWKQWLLQRGQLRDGCLSEMLTRALLSLHSQRASLKIVIK